MLTLPVAKRAVFVELVEFEHVVEATDILLHDIVDCFLREREILRLHDRRGEQIQAKRIGAVLVDDLHRVGIILKLLRHLLAVFGEHDTVDDHILECVLAEETAGEHVQIVEPRARLIQSLGDELRREDRVELLFVVERIVRRAVWHRARVEPGVEHIGNTVHRAPAGARHRDLIDDVFVEVVDLLSTRFFELRCRAEDTLLFAFFADPHRDHTCPESLAADRPIARTFEPLAESPLFDVLGRPVHLLGILEQIALELGDRHEP